MLERLFAALVNGPSLNCRPHSSRQRVDWTLVGKLKDGSPEDALRRLLGKDEEVKLTGRVTMPRRMAEIDEDDAVDDTVAANGDGAGDAELKSKLSPEERAARQAWTDQVSLLGKLRGIAEDAKTYEQDTGVHVLNIGFPLLSLPPSAVGGKGRGGATRRIVAPIAFVPVSVVVKSGATAGVTISCKGEGVDRITPNTALLAWLEQQTGKKAEAELFEDAEGTNPWREVSELVRHVCRVMGMGVPELFEEVADEKSEATSEKREEGASLPAPGEGLEDGVSPDPAGGAVVVEAAREKAEAGRKPRGIDLLALQPAPRADEAGDEATIHVSAVLGLFPVANQGLLRDMQAMARGEALVGPVTSFVQSNVSLDAPPEPAAGAPEQPAVVERKTRRFADERLVAQADPCQSRAVKLARQARGLVIHGPPGTGKSQTITNIIGDHLSRGERVLLVSDKRTALDVVANRLEHMGLGSLVALIHDPQRDQRDLYRTIREQLEVLADVKTEEKAERQLAKVDEELQGLHAELTEYWDALMKESPATSGGLSDSFHALVGRWLAVGDSPELARVEKLGAGVALEDLDQHAHLIDETFARAAKVGWWANPWREAAGVELAAFVGTPMDKWREAMGRCVDAAGAADAAIDPAIPPFAPQIELKQQADARADLATRLERALAGASAEVRQRWVGQEAAAQERVRRRLAEVEPQVQTLRAAALEADLAMVARERGVGMAQIASALGALEGYLDVARKWHAIFQFGRKARAREALGQFGLALSADNAERLKRFLWGLRARMVLQALHYDLYQLTPPPVGLLSDEVIERTLAEHREVLEVVAHARGTPALAPLLPRAIETLKDGAGTLVEGLRKSAARAAAVVKLEEALAASRLLAGVWLADFDAKLRAGERSSEVVGALAERVGDVESVLRIRAALAKLPDGVRRAVVELTSQPVDPATAVGAIRKASLAAEITRRLASDARLQNVDGERVSGAFERYRKLEEKKRGLVRDVILHQWTSRQKERLLASTGSRLGALGAELKRRLTMRGERAMRLRQVLAAGQKTDGGDPLFDVCPVWMASPETVAQLFERKEVFSVVIFDEASQCRLEETLPVLTRGHRVVIAGDPKQLPPTRFFESAVAQSEDEEIETDQQLFEAQQGEIEDLLGAALNLEIEQAYLDVHYRSKSAELIEFSNEHFYGSRLQAIPGHPSNQTAGAPLLLHRADGVYDKGRNEAEAVRVVELVRDLLKGKEPPSIGIACFNLQQRDLIVEKLEELAVEDERFGRKLADARQRQGKGSFEGLFVKNLENVQGDERDHMIISTTYGPDAGGRFYRRFGPLGRAGGGRRLNVLVTRAREAVHLVTSIPAEVYRALPPVPAGQAPTGGWLLFAYLKYAEEVGAAYAVEETSEASENGDGHAGGETPQAEGADGAAGGDGPAPVRKLATKTPSVLAEALAGKLASDHRVPSDVYWGNDGFLVDVALRHPARPADVTVGVLVDASRFANVEDPVEWDVFRTGVHEQQGWTLHRVWSPHFFRDPRGVTTAILAEAKADQRP
jgi:hypothetical protein